MKPYPLETSNHLMVPVISIMLRISQSALHSLGCSFGALPCVASNCVCCTMIHLRGGTHHFIVVARFGHGTKIRPKCRARGVGFAEAVHNQDLCGVVADHR